MSECTGTPNNEIDAMGEVEARLGAQPLDTKPQFGMPFTEPLVTLGDRNEPACDREQQTTATEGPRRGRVGSKVGHRSGTSARAVSFPRRLSRSP